MKQVATALPTLLLMCDETSCNSIANVVAAVLMCDETSCNYILLRLLTSDFDVLRFIRDARLLRNQFVSSDVSSVSYSHILSLNLIFIYIVVVCLI